MDLIELIPCAIEPPEHILLLPEDLETNLSSLLLNLKAIMFTFNLPHL